MTALGTKDLTTKKLEDYNDVFADIYNTLLFGKPLIQESQLEHGPTESIYKAENDTNAEQRRDTLKYYKSGAGETQLVIAALGMENQSTVDKTMPIRIMGYDFGSYNQQLTQAKTKPARLYPVITIVLNFSETRWGNAKGLHDILTIPDELKEYVQDYRIHVFDIAFLEDGVIEQFTSDFKPIARFFRDKRLNKNSLTSDKTIVKYPEAIAEFLAAFTNDRDYINTTKYIAGYREKGDVITMCTIAQSLIQEGRQTGIQEGGIKMLYSLVEEHMLTPEMAAQKMKISVDDLKKLFQKYGFDCNI